MRLIKFRGKSVEDEGGEWVYGSFISGSGVGYDYILTDDALWFDSVTTVITDTVGQFTGLHDKNGNEIYEGDIVKTILHDSRRQMFFKVIYSMDYCGFELQEYGRYSGGYLWNFDDFDEGSLIIIGNIHDNPELIKQND